MVGLECSEKGCEAVEKAPWSAIEEVGFSCVFFIRFEKNELGSMGLDSD